MGGRFQGMSEGWEHGVVGMAAVVGRRTWGERGLFALARLQLSSLLSSPAQYTPSLPLICICSGGCRELSRHLPGDSTGSSLLEGWFGGEVEKYC